MAFLLRRLLVFTLSRIDLLDKDPTDHDFTVSVGKQSTLELRDVGLKTEKLLGLLSLDLPPQLRLIGARVSLLRITLTDIWNPSIQIKVEGVRVRAQLNADKSATGRQTKDSKEHRDKSRKHGVSHNTADEIPTAEDLAKSFVAEAPLQERKDLEDVLKTQTQDLSESTVSADSDEDANLGYGAPSTLSGSLENLIRSALNRCEVDVTDISVRLDASVPGKERKDIGKDTDTTELTFNFAIERALMEALSTDPTIQLEASEANSISHTTKMGRRRISLRSIGAELVSSPDTFLNLARPSRPLSPVESRTSTTCESKRSMPSSPASTHSLGSAQCSVRSPSPEPPTLSESILSSQSSTISASMHESVLLENVTASGSLSASSATHDDDRYADAGSDEEHSPPHRSLQLHDDPHSVEYRFDHPEPDTILADRSFLAYALDNGMWSSRLEENADDTEGSQMQALRIQEPQQHEPQQHEPQQHEPQQHKPQLFDPQSTETSAQLPALASLDQGHNPARDGVNKHLIDLRSNSSNQEAFSDASATPDLKTYRSTDNLVHAIRVQVDDRQGHDMIEATKESLVEDLSESRLYDHEEVESMYMSAYSEAFDSSQPMPIVPGAWEYQEPDSVSEKPHTPKPKPDAQNDAQASNLSAEDRSRDKVAQPESDDAIFGGQQSNVYLFAEGTPHNSGKGPGLDSKTFLTIDEGAVWVPWPGHPSNLSAKVIPSSQPASGRTALDESIYLEKGSLYRDLPGTFSVYADAQKSPTSCSKSSADTENTKPSDADNQIHQFGIELDLGRIHMQVDIMAGQLILQAIQYISRIFQPTGEDHPSVKKIGKQSLRTGSDKDKSSITSIFELTIKSLRFLWLESIPSHSFGPGSIKDYPCDDLVNIILRFQMARLAARAISSAENARIRATIKNLAFGTAEHDLIVFDGMSRMRTSVRDLKEPLDGDVTIDYNTSLDKSELTLSTLPIRVNFDVSRLDEAFSAFGGLSGMLELGNSISSTHTSQTHRPQSGPRPRAVHFARPAPVQAAPLGLPLRINARFGGLLVDVKGKSCSIQLKTTAVKVVGRHAGVRIQIDKVKSSGPYVDGGNESSASSPFTLSVEDIRLDFLFSPEETDLTQLLSILTPPKDRYEDDNDILVDALIRQRQKGSVLRLNMAAVDAFINDFESCKKIVSLGDELTRLSTVTKYLPEDDRPGLLSMVRINNLNVTAELEHRIGTIDLTCSGLHASHVGWPSLLAVEVSKIQVRRNEELLLHPVLPLPSLDQLPMFMARKVGDEIEPTIKLKLYNACVEYRVSTILAFLDLGETDTSGQLVANLADSVVTITGPSSPRLLTRQASAVSTGSNFAAKTLHIDFLLRDCAVGLNPQDAASKALLVLTDTRLTGVVPRDENVSAKLELRKASLLLVDDVARLTAPDEDDNSGTPRTSALGGRQVVDLCRRGFVSMSTISSAVASVLITKFSSSDECAVNINIRNDLLLLELCADSTQTLISLLDGLNPPLPPSKDVQYRYEVMDMRDMMASFSGDAHGKAHDDHLDEDDLDIMDDDLPANLDFLASIYNADSLPTNEELGDQLLEGDLPDFGPQSQTSIDGQRRVVGGVRETCEARNLEDRIQLQRGFSKDLFSPKIHADGIARKWNSEKGQVGWKNEFGTPSPLKVRVRDVSIIMHLFDGYDWAHTRDTITQAVHDVEQRAEERRHRGSTSADDDVSVEEDFLFNSVWISLPVTDEQGTLAKRINREIDDVTSETGSYATSTASGATIRPKSARPRKRSLKLNRSRHHKVSFELSKVAADVVVFPPGSGENQSSIDVRVQDFEIFDLVPTSTWKKFATYMKDAGERETNQPMIKLSLNTVRPTPTLAATELVLRVTVLPLRLHVDQDALDFITRFFEFKPDDKAPKPKGEEPFIQRLEVDTVQLRLDYKPKKVDYAGLRSGHTTEFMNFFILDAADITLQHCIVYGIPGFDKVHKMLNDIWMPDVKAHQLPGVLSGLAPVRPLVNVGTGVSNLVIVPIREYQKDGRIVRSVQKGALAFAKSTTTELARLGAKVAIGTQTVLQGAEDILSPSSSSSNRPISRHADDWEDLSSSSPPSPPRAISQYADQPMNVMAGLRSAARSLERDLLTTRDVIMAIPAEVRESESATGAALAIARLAPTVVLRPAGGALRALGGVLNGVGNQIDREGRRRVEEKYKSRY